MPSTFFEVETSLKTGEHYFMTYAYFDLFLLNTGAHMHLCVGSGASSTLELTLCSLSIATQFDLSFLPDLNYSDRYPV
jgi:hypothetical protein